MPNVRRALVTTRSEAPMVPVLDGLVAEFKNTLRETDGAIERILSGTHTPDDFARLERGEAMIGMLLDAVG